MNSLSVVERYKNRTIPFRFDGAELSFHLSLALFSSYDVDAGTKLLLKTLAQRVDFSKARNLLDLGCGVGTIGLSIAKRHPHLRVTLQDRDVLAVRFSQANAAMNGIDNCTTSADLAFLRLPEEHYDLIVSNLPAKAGEPVLRLMVEHMISQLGSSGNGVAAAVVVEPLRKAVGRMIAESGAHVLCKESTDSHTVYHFAPAGEANGSPNTPFDHEASYSLPRPYFRTEVRTSLHGLRYAIDTVWGLRDFDTPGFEAQLFSQWAVKTPPSERLLVWNPGQGHIPAIALSAWGETLSSIDLAGRDTLALAASAHNLLFRTGGGVFAAADFREAAEMVMQGENPRYGTVVIDLEHIPSVLREEHLRGTAPELLADGGRLVIVGKSSDLHPYSKGWQDFSLTYSQKHKGNRLLGLRYEPNGRKPNGGPPVD